MTYLIDTNVISEVRKGDRCDSNVAAWYRSVDGEQLFLSVLVLGEIRKGVELVRARNPSRALSLERWLGQVEAAFDGQILGVDKPIADQWGRMSAPRSIPVTDGLLAATAAVHDLTLVTRNESDVADLGVRVLNPFAQRPGT